MRYVCVCVIYVHVPPGLTMLPGSVEALAKMKMALGQLAEFPFSKSLRVDDNWRASISLALETSAGEVGRAAAMPAAVRSERNFMSAVFSDNLVFRVVLYKRI